MTATILNMERYVDGVLLHKNLYKCQHGRPNRWRYRKVYDDGSSKMVVIKEVLTVAEANELAQELDALEIPASKTGYSRDFVTRYVAWEEKNNPSLKLKESWTNRKYAFYQFAEHFDDVRHITLHDLSEWWDDLTFNQQKLRHASLRKFFNWLMRKSYTTRLKYNPFTTADDLPRLIVKQKPKKQRAPCTPALFSQIREEAGQRGYECLQIAMDISRYTTLREGDICALRFDKNIVDGYLKVVVGKSEAQRGSVRAARLQWYLKDHPLLKSYIDRARELSLKNRACPFIINHTPKHRSWNDNRTHTCQVTGDRLSRMFAECRGDSKTTFHEIRGLSSTLFKLSGYTDEQIQQIMAHEDKTTTQGYQNAEILPYQNVNMRIEH